MSLRSEARGAVPGWTGRAVVCALLAVAGGLLAVGAVADLWLSTLSFGGPEGSPDVGRAQAGSRLLLVACGTLGPLGVAWLLLRRVPPALVLAAVAVAAGLGAAVLGLAA